jgi:CxxC motif-containing protein
MTELICITCPTGCSLQAELVGEKLTVTGNECKRGLAFARAELTRPLRSLCSTVRTAFPGAPMLPVRTDREIPKEKIPEVMRLLAGVLLKEPIACGGIVCTLEPICEGNLIATSNLIAMNDS